MKKFIVGLVVMAMAGQVFAAFQAPTKDQIDAAAKDPAKIKAMLQDATPQQAADVVKAVIASVAAQGLQPAAQTAAINAVVAQAVAAMPQQAVALSAALGTVMKADPVVAALAPTVSQALTVTVPTVASAPPVIAVVNAFNAAVNLPPVATGYDVQGLR